jgi:hypothetical protein
MRAILVAGLFAVTVLAGCTQGTPDRGEEFKPSCPSWTKGLGTLQMAGPGWFHPALNHTESRDNISQVMTFDGRPLDWFELDFHVKRNPQTGEVVTQNGTPVQQYLFVSNGTLRVQFFRNDTGELLRVYDSSKGAPGPNNPKREALSWAPGFYTNFTIHVDLVDVNQPASPTMVYAIWTLFGDRSGDPERSAWAVRDTTVFFWYRNCNVDGSSARIR